MPRQYLTTILVATSAALLPVPAGAQAATEDPFTVPAGRMQAEFDLASFERSVRATRLELGATNLRVGITSTIDLQVRIAPLVQDRVWVGEDVHASAGLGDLTVRAKMNLFGTGDSPIAMAVIPFVSVQPDDNGARQATIGTAIPVALNLGGDWQLGTMITVGRERRESGDGYRGFIESSVNASRGVAPSVQAFVEVWNAVAAEPLVGWQASANSGVTWSLSESTELAAAISVGLTRATPAVKPFIGLTVRF